MSRADGRMPEGNVSKRKYISTNLPQTLHANSGKGASGLFKSGMTGGAGNGGFLFLTTACPVFDPLVDAPVVFRFLRLGSEGFIKLLEMMKQIQMRFKIYQNYDKRIETSKLLIYLSYNSDRF